MSELSINTHLLAESLKKGMQTERIYSFIPKEALLRTAVCGTVSTAIHLSTTALGIQSRLVVTRPLQDIDDALEHVFTVIGSDAKTLIVDASYSQFMEYIGPIRLFENTTKQQVFPEEEVLTMPPSDVITAARILTNACIDFREAQIKFPNWQTSLTHSPAIPKPLYDAPADYLQARFEEIWDMEFSSDWKPSARTLEAAKKLAPHIPPEAFTC